jgi:precorrin-8X/cobalt-precorrin-8 methylmutase
VPTEARAPTTLLERYGLPPGEVERLSLARLEEQVGASLPEDPAARHLMRRILYAAGDPALAPMVLVHPSAVAVGVEALSAGAPVIVDVCMVAAGIHQDALRRLGCSLVVAIDEPRARRVAIEAGITRSAAAFRLIASRLGGAVVAIGNAPTGLLALLDLVDAGAPPPAVILGMPVGLVAAAESKVELAKRATPYATVLGTRGGSPLAAAAVNGLVDLVSHERAGIDGG